MIRIGVLGAKGRMGQELVALLRDGVSFPNAILSGVVVKPEDTNLLKLENIPVYSKIEDLLACSDVLIDFTNPEASMSHAYKASEHNIAFVCGTTGFSDDQLLILSKQAAKSPIFWAPNMSLGVAFLKFAAKAAAQFFSDEFDIEIIEAHHNRKVDAPSGTAILLGQACAQGRGVDYDEVVTAHTNGPRKRGAIGMSVVRAGSIVGEHSVMFVSDSERIELTHKASDRSVFAHGAVSAAHWLYKQIPGKLYGMADLASQLSPK
jgi:4-hydroxy-tetrahydrodipicolinate reductase